MAAEKAGVVVPVEPKKEALPLGVVLRSSTKSNKKCAPVPRVHTLHS